MSSKRFPIPCVETLAASIGTAFCVLLMALTAINAGPLWRDEVNTLNLAQMPSLRDLWNNLPFESFPPLWPLLLRGASFLGLLNSDAGVRIAGFCVGLFFLASLWLCSRWVGARAPILSVALLGSLPAFIFIAGANRAYGLACCLSVLSFGTLWRLVELPSKSRIFWAGLVCFLFAQCLYYDSIFLCAMLAGAAIVTIRRKEWKIFSALTGIGLVCGISMLIYLPIIHRGSAFLPLIRAPFFNSAAVWNGLCDALAGRSSGNPAGGGGPEIWFWIELILIGLVVAVATQWKPTRRMANRDCAATNAPTVRSDLNLFCLTSIVFGVLGYFAFLLSLQFFLQTWYYIGILAVCAISLDGILGAGWPALRPWGLLRIAFLVLVMAWGAKPAWAEAHTRRTNMDTAAAFLDRNASAGDFIVVQEVWEGITFNRYYNGHARWVTIPPIDSHKVHRTDLVMKKMTDPQAMTPVLREISATLSHGHSVWLVGNLSVTPPRAFPPGLPPPPPPPPQLPTKWWLGSYLYWWDRQAATLLLEEASQEQKQDIPAPMAVNSLEDVSVIRFSGYKSATK